MPPATQMQAASTTQVMNRDSPIAPPTDSASWSCFAAAIEEKTSGAPLPKAKSVTPCGVKEATRKKERISPEWVKVANAWILQLELD